MTERTLRNIFVLGSLFLFVVLAVMTVSSLRQVTSTRTPALTASVVAGKDTWRRQNCNDCHTILGIGGYFAPDLTKVADKRDSAWLVQWLVEPQSVEAGVSMPNPHLAAAQIEGLLAFFQWVREIDTSGWPPPPAKASGGAGATPTTPPQGQ